MNITYADQFACDASQEISRINRLQIALRHRAAWRKPHERNSGGPASASFETSPEVSGIAYSSPGTPSWGIVVGILDHSAAALNDQLNESIACILQAVRAYDTEAIRNEIRFLQRFSDSESASQQLLAAINSARQSQEIEWLAYAMSEMPYPTSHIVLSAIQSAKSPSEISRYCRVLSALDRPVASAEIVQDMRQTLDEAFFRYEDVDARESIIEGTCALPRDERNSLLASWAIAVNSQGMKEFIKDAMD